MTASANRARTGGDEPRRVSGTIVGEARSERFAAFERRYAAVSRLLDELVPIPGTDRRIGLDPVVGLIPGIGDLVSGAIGFWLIAEAARFRIPTVVLGRMVLNTLVDLVVGAIPFLGDIFDALSKSNSRNLELFRRYATDPGASTRSHRLFMVGLLLVVVGLVWLAVTAIVWVLSIEIPAP